MSNENDLQAMQTLLAHHERQIQDLSEIVMRQQKDIDRLRAVLEKTGSKLAALEVSVSEGQGDKLSVTEQALRDKPPHY